MYGVSGFQEAIQTPILFELAYRPVHLRDDFHDEKPIDEFHDRLADYFPIAADHLRQMTESDGRTKLYTWIQFGLKKLSQDGPSLVEWKKYKSYDITAEGLSVIHKSFCAACENTEEPKLKAFADAWPGFIAYLTRIHLGPPPNLQDLTDNATVLDRIATLTPGQFKWFLQSNGDMTHVRHILAERLRRIHGLT